MLRQAGFDVIEGTNGREALDKVRENPDVVVLDVRLPDISGVDVCRIIKSDPATSSIPVLHLSASYTSSGHKAEGLDAGADGYLVRPVEPIELVATVNALLRQRCTEQALRASEERYRLLVDSVRDYAIVTVSMEGRVVSWNSGAERVTGYSESDIVGRPVAMLFEKSTSRRSRTNWRRRPRRAAARASAGWCGRTASVASRAASPRQCGTRLDGWWASRWCCATSPSSGRPRAHAPTAKRDSGSSPTSARGCSTASVRLARTPNRPIG